MADQSNQAPNPSSNLEPYSVAEGQQDHEVNESDAQHEAVRAVMGGAERRRHERTELTRRGMLAELDSDGHPGLEVACETVDISRGGLGLKCKRMITPGRMIRVRITGPGGLPAVLFGVVRACRYAGEGMHILGMQFQLTHAGKKNNVA